MSVMDFVQNKVQSVRLKKKKPRPAWNCCWLLTNRREEPWSWWKLLGIKRKKLPLFLKEGSFSYKF
jgi:hypothetical protein